MCSRTAVHPHQEETSHGYCCEYLHKPAFCLPCPCYPHARWLHSNTVRVQMPYLYRPQQCMLIAGVAHELFSTLGCMVAMEMHQISSLRSLSMQERILLGEEMPFLDRVT